ncbi:MAG: GNAT family N-acetyltransferase [Bacilli bacterium]
MNKEIDVTGKVIKTKRITLRPFCEDDLDDFYEYAKVDGVGQMAGWLPHKSLQESKDILDMLIAGKNQFAIVFENKVIGSIGIEKYNEKEAEEFSSLQGREIGYVLAKDYWGQGLMTEAVQRVIKYLFDEVNLDFIAGCFFKRNSRSKRVQEKNGFKYYKDIIYETRYGTKEESSYMILTKEEYFKQNKK